MRMSLLLKTCVLWAMVPATVMQGHAQTTAAPSAVKVSLRVQDDAVYLKAPLRLLFTFVNEGTTPVTLDASIFAHDRFRIVDQKGRGPGKVSTEAAAARPVRIDGMETIQHQVDLSHWYPALTGKLRTWEISWSHPDLSTEPLRVSIMRPYDPRKDRKVVVETDLGRMVWRLMPEHAPAHVKHFVDLVRQGFYDGSTIYRAIPGLIAEGGDPQGDGTGGWDRLQMPEMSQTLKMKMGLIGAMRRESSLTNNHIFFITLTPNEYMAGLQTFFAEVVEGIEVVARLHRVPTHGDTQDRFAFLLEPPVKITRMSLTR